MESVPESSASKIKLEVGMALGALVGCPVTGIVGWGLGWLAKAGAWVGCGVGQLLTSRDLNSATSLSASAPTYTYTEF
jgi:hypothetical protein